MKPKIILLTTILVMLLLVLAALIFVLSNPYTPYPMSKYVKLLTELQGHNYTLVHDCDFNIAGIRWLLQTEQGFNVQATYYLRPDADYFTQNIAYFQTLQNQGVHFGFHFDCLSRSNGSMALATKLFISQVAYLRSFLNISTTRSHGDNYNLKINNHDLYNQTLWRELHLTDYSNECGLFDTYIADTNHQWTQPETLGQHILVNLHSDYWG